MNSYNLTDRQKNILRELVRAYRSGYDEEFSFAPTLGSDPAIEFFGNFGPIRADESDLLALESEGFIILRRAGPYSLMGNLRGKAFDGVDADFQPPQIAANPSIINNFQGTFISTNIAAGGVSHQLQIHGATTDPSVVALLQQMVDRLAEQREMDQQLREDTLIQLEQVLLELKKYRPDKDWIERVLDSLKVVIPFLTPLIEHLLERLR